MSVQAITCALALRGVSASEKLLLLALANYADENMRAWPSQKRLAGDTCLSDRTVRTLLAGLEARGLLSRKEARRQDGSRSVDVITLHFSGEVSSKQQAEVVSGGAEMVSGGVRKSLPGGAEMVSGLTTFEPSTEPREADASPIVVSAKPKPTTGPSISEVQTAFDEWNLLAKRLGLPAARKLDEARRRSIRSRLADGGLEGWREALAAVAASPLCRGESDRQWRADLDFVCTASKYRRLREGAYGAPTKDPPKPPEHHARQVPLITDLSPAEIIARAKASLGNAA